MKSPLPGGLSPRIEWISCSELLRKILSPKNWENSVYGGRTRVKTGKGRLFTKHQFDHFFKKKSWSPDFSARLTSLLDENGWYRNPWKPFLEVLLKKVSKFWKVKILYGGHHLSAGKKRRCGPVLLRPLLTSLLDENGWELVQEGF